MSAADRPNKLTPAELDQVIADARTAAIQQVRAALADSFTETMLAQALAHLAHETTSPETPTPPPGRADATDEKRAHAARELAALKQQLARNEAALQPQSSPTPEPAVDDEAVIETGIYLYGITAADTEPLPDSLPDGVYALSHGRLQAIVRQIDVPAFETQGQDMAWLTGAAQRHQQCLADVADTTAVIPFRFGTVLRTKADVQAMLADRAAEFAAALTLVDGRREWGVKLFRTADRLTAQVAESVEMKKMSAAVTTQSAGKAYFARKKQQQALETAVAHKQDDLIAELHETLSSHAHRAYLNPPPSAQLLDRTDPLLLNGAYLVDRPAEAAFHTAVETAAQQYDDLGFNVELSGPWPAYNFVDV